MRFASFDHVDRYSAGKFRAELFFCALLCNRECSIYILFSVFWRLLHEKVSDAIESAASVDSFFSGNQRERCCAELQG